MRPFRATVALWEKYAGTAAAQTRQTLMTSYCVCDRLLKRNARKLCFKNLQPIKVPTLRRHVRRSRGFWARYNLASTVLVVQAKPGSVRALDRLRRRCWTTGRRRRFVASQCRLSPHQRTNLNGGDIGHPCELVPFYRYTDQHPCTQRINVSSLVSALLPPRDDITLILAADNVRTFLSNSKDPRGADTWEWRRRRNTLVSFFDFWWGRFGT